MPEALAVLRTYELITVLFADINLEEGGPNGLELAQEAVAMRPRLKVLYTTGPDLTDGTRALFVAGSAFLTLPALFVAPLTFPECLFTRNSISRVA